MSSAEPVSPGSAVDLAPRGSDHLLRTWRGAAACQGPRGRQELKLVQRVLWEGKQRVFLRPALHGGCVELCARILRLHPG